MSRLKVAVVALLLASGLSIGIFVAVLIFSPASLLLPLANSTLDNNGYKVTRLDALRLGTESTSIGNATITGNGMQFSIQGINLSYNILELRQGHLQSLTISKIEIELGSEVPDTSAEIQPVSISQMLQSLDQIPIDLLQIDSISLLPGAEIYNFDVAIKTNPLTLNGELNFNDSNSLKIEFDAEQTGYSNFDFSSKLLIENSAIITSELEITAQDDAILIDARSRIDMSEATKVQFMDTLPADTIFLNKTLLVQSQFSLIDIFTAPSIQEILITLDSPASTLSVRQQSELGENSFQIQLPVSISGKIASLQTGIELSASDIIATGSWLNETAELSAESTIANTQLSCSDTSNCNMSIDLNYIMNNWKAGDLWGENLTLSGPVNFNLANNELRVAVPSLNINIPNVETATTSSSVQLSIENLGLKIGNDVTAEFTFTSKSFSPDLGSASMSDPTISGKISFKEETLTAIVEVDLNDQLKMGVALQHFFLRDTGEAEIQLAPLEFSSTYPLSSLISQSLINGDLVGGRILAHANISWSMQESQQWVFGGPVILDMQNISGFYEDVFFLNLNSKLFTEVTTPLGLRTNTAHSATVASLDIGVPIENISWQYAFDSLKKQFQIDDLTTEVLEGRINIPHMDYQLDRDLNEFNIIISNLNLSSIVGLANYPELQVDGLISGYLPLVISDNKLTIEEGLISALKPGGSIRYTPVDPTPSANPSIQLVNDALSNYQFETLNTEVFFDEAGELRLEVQLRGNNPDMNDGQDINLNVNITDNIPALMRSLQASRVITDELERLLQ
ncbi:MAG: hypothetical protein COA96_10025 [SAR86 cluster bacterium]|uniref:Uncharacterized protein n=1 Tax=SAR86 cluster bacterium TaxID=2030880 RepID=A0A2A5AY33_9GAMM|nr:MAG: hypothetical protein COA96_10025 [SAR86 cluster bacterium]